MSPLLDLAQAQSALLQALFGSRCDAALQAHVQLGGPRGAWHARGLQAYQANGSALAERVLQAAFPVLAELMGQDNFLPLARYFWRQSPPLRGDLGQWGAALPAFLDTAAQVADEPFLGDIARLEWALHTAATSADAALDAASLVLLTGSDPAHISLQLSGGVALLASAFPVVSIMAAHSPAAPDKTAAIAQAADQLRLKVAQHALVWRQGFKPRLRACSAAEHALLTALLAGQSLGHALHAASLRDDAAEAFDFSTWLGQAVQTGLMTGVYLLHHHPSQLNHRPHPDQ